MDNRIAISGGIIGAGMSDADVAETEDVEDAEGGEETEGAGGGKKKLSGKKLVLFIALPLLLVLLGGGAGMMFLFSDFVLKRTLRHSKTGKKFPPSIFMENPRL